MTASFTIKRGRGVVIYNMTILVCMQYIKIIHHTLLAVKMLQALERLHIAHRQTYTN